MATMSSNLEQAVQEIHNGELVLLSDAPDREGEADLVFAAQHVDPDKIISLFYLCSGGGLLCVPMQKQRLEFLGLEPRDGGKVIPQGRDHCKFYTGVDFRYGGSGVGARDRASVISALVHDIGPISSEDSNLASKGHTFPLCITRNGLYDRQGHTEGSVALVELAGLSHPVAVIQEVFDPLTGSPMKGERLTTFAREKKLTHVTIAEIMDYQGIIPVKERQ